MRFILLLIIRVYWLIPEKKRKNCLFKESCSHYVFTITRQKGFKEGFKALKLRLKQCKPGYYLFKTKDGSEWLMLKDKTIIPREQTTV